MATKAKTYQQLTDELNQLLDWFESDQVNLDDAVDKYEQALKLIDQLEAYLKTVENRVKKISVQFD